MKDKVPKEFDTVNLSFSENYILQMNKYFESEKDEVKLASYYETKYTRIFKENLLHITFIVFLVLLLFFTSFPSWHNSINSAFGASFESLIITRDPNFTNKSIHNISKIICYLASSKDVQFLCFNTTKQLFRKTKSGQYVFLSSNILIQNSYLITVRRANKDPNFLNSSIPIRKYQNIDPNTLMTAQNLSNLQILNPKYIIFL